MLLAIDVGNTQTIIGLFGADEHAHELVEHWRIATSADRTSDELMLLIWQLLGRSDYEADRDVTGIAVSCNVPALSAELRAMADRWFHVPTMILEPGVRTGIPIRYDDPREVGADRIANSVGAFDLYGGPTVIVDFGTAVIFDVVSAGAEYLGGAIVPGIEVSMDALFGRAAGLRRVELIEPRNVIGRTTVESVQSGVIYGYAALVDGMVNRITSVVGTATVIATGSLADFFTHHCSTIDHVEPWVTLHGLRLIWERNTAR